MCLFVGLLFLVGVPIAFVTGAFTSSEVPVALALWAMGWLALVGRVMQARQRRG